jgi:hypothetical protein
VIVSNAGYGLFGRGGGTHRQAGRTHYRDQPGRVDPADPCRAAAPSPLGLVLGSQALESSLTTLRKRIADFEAQTKFAVSTDFPPGG